MYKDVSKFMGNSTPLGESGSLFTAICVKSKMLTKLSKKGPIKLAVAGLLKKFENNYKQRLLMATLRANIGPQGLPE